MFYDKMRTLWIVKQGKAVKLFLMPSFPSHSTNIIEEM